jgi:hypothetical protein
MAAKESSRNKAQVPTAYQAGGLAWAPEGLNQRFIRLRALMARRSWAAPGQAMAAFAGWALSTSAKALPAFDLADVL